MIAPQHKTMYGRRQGRTLGNQRRNLMEELLPKLSIELEEKPLVAFDSTSEIWLEIGFGAGEHLATQAERNPDVGFIGCEAFRNGVASLLSLIDAKGLSNIRIYPNDARELVARLPNQCLDRVFILFPDPWPKTSHHKRRLINQEFITEIMRILKSDGELQLASDDQHYVNSMIEAVRSNKNLSLVPKEDWDKQPNDWVETRYEKRAKRLGNRCTYLRVFRNKT